MGYKYNAVYWAYSEYLDLNYVGVKSFNNWGDFEEYKTSSTNKEFKDYLSWKEPLYVYSTREEAYSKEYELLKKLNAVRSDAFANRANYLEGKFYNKGNPTIYRWVNPKTKEFFTGTCSEFYTRYNITPRLAQLVCTGKRRSTSNWKCICLLSR